MKRLSIAAMALAMQDVDSVQSTKLTRHEYVQIPNRFAGGSSKMATEYIQAKDEDFMEQLNDHYDYGTYSLAHESHMSRHNDRVVNQNYRPSKYELSKPTPVTNPQPQASKPWEQKVEAPKPQEHATPKTVEVKKDTPKLAEDKKEKETTTAKAQGESREVTIAKPKAEKKKEPKAEIKEPTKTETSVVEHKMKDGEEGETTDTLEAGKSLKAGDSLISKNKRCKAFIKPDENFVVMREFPDTGKELQIWDTETHVQKGDGPAELEMKPEGLSMKKGSLLAWHIGGKDVGKLVIQDDCNMVLYTSSGGPLWDTGTNENWFKMEKSFDWEKGAEK